MTTVTELMLLKNSTICALLVLHLPVKNIQKQTNMAVIQRLICKLSRLPLGQDLLVYVLMSWF